MEEQYVELWIKSVRGLWNLFGSLQRKDAEQIAAEHFSDTETRIIPRHSVTLADIIDG